jgi:hypothetical protein
LRWIGDCSQQRFGLTQSAGDLATPGVCTPVGFSLATMVSQVRDLVFGEQLEFRDGAERLGAGAVAAGDSRAR